jgi:asparagine synthetase B (glutamine-hydrolysing)
MCGIAGIFDPQMNEGELDHQVATMAEVLLHRGPDDGGTLDSSVGIAFGHRRLSIIDVSPLGHQPMASASERYVLAYNGEDYDFWEIRHQLEQGGATFRGHSDTDVLLAQDHIVANGYFKPEPVRQLWQQFLADRPANEASLWGVLMFQRWLDGFRTKEAS